MQHKGLQPLVGRNESKNVGIFKEDRTTGGVPLTSPPLTHDRL